MKPARAIMAALLKQKRADLNRLWDEQPLRMSSAVLRNWILGPNSPTRGTTTRE